MRNLRSKFCKARNQNTSSFCGMKLLKKRTGWLCALCVVFLILLSACDIAKPSAEPRSTPESLPVAAAAVPDLKKTYDMEYLGDCTVSEYEPTNGCYLGAYVLANPKINYSITEFERLTGKEHLIYSYYLKLGGELPLTWTLECMTRGKLPMVVITPSNDFNTFDAAALKKTAESFRQLNTPVLVQFFPEPDKQQFERDEYIKFFQQAYDIFKEAAPKTALVFSVSGDDKDLKRYYPGDDFTDWVGLNISEDIQGEGGTYESDLFKNLDYFYQTFQKAKPIMLSQLAVSHYTSKNHSYYVKDAAQEISRIYNGLRSYPRVKAVVYMDFDNMQLKQDGVRDNFSITDNETVLDAYKTAIADDTYLNALAAENMSGNENEKDIRTGSSALVGTSTRQFLKSSEPVRKIGKELYISADSLKNDLNIDVLSQYDSILAEGEMFYSLESLKERAALDYLVFENAKRIRIF